MIRHIKRSVKYLIIFLGVIVMLPTVLYLILQTAEVQTFLVKRITGHFSEEIKSTISVGSIRYKFFNRLDIKDLLIKDQNNDTLIYSKQLTAGIRDINIRNKTFRLGKVSLMRPVFALITDSSGQNNLTWYLNLLKSKPDTTKSVSAHVGIDQVEITDGRFALINMTGAKGKTKIDFNNLRLSGIYGTVEDLRTHDDTTRFSLYSLACHESSGFTVKRFSTAVILARQNILLNSLVLNCDSTILNMQRLALIADSSDAFKNFTEKVRLDAVFDKSLISTRDLKYFIPAADSLDESVTISGKILGTVSELRGRKVKINYRNSTSIDCDFDFSGLPKIENTFLFIGVNNLRTTISDLEKIKVNRKHPIVLPEAFKKLGTISFNGSFTGFTTDFVTYGELRTELGNIRTDISLRPDEAGKYKVKGLLAGNNINLGELAENTELLGHFSIHANVDGSAYSFKKFSGKLSGKIDSIEINRYNYRNIDLNGDFTEKTWDGSINISDKNLKLNLLGLLNFNNKLPEFDFTLNVASSNLYKLNLDKLDTTASASLLLTSNFKGDNIDNLDGEIKLINSKFRKFGNDLEMYDMSIKATRENDKPAMMLRTDFVDADIRGNYSFATIGSLVKSTLSSLMPSQFHFKDIKNDFRKNKFTFEARFKKTDKINNFFHTGVLLSDKSFIKGSVYADSLIFINGKSDQLTYRNNVFKDLELDTRIGSSQAIIDLTSSSLSLLGQSDLKDFKVNFKTRPDNFIFTVGWDNKDKILNQGSFIARGTVIKNPTGNGKTILDVEIDSSKVYADNNLWVVRKSSLMVDTTAIKINKFIVAGGDRSYMIDGAVSSDPSDTLHLNFKGIDISPLNYLITRKNNDPTALSPDFKGRLGGKILLSNVYKSMLLAGNIKISRFSVLGQDMGELTINADLDRDTRIVNINAGNNVNSSKTFIINGFYNPGAKKIDLTVDAIKLPITFLNPLLKSFASDISGFASGRLRLMNEGDNLYLLGGAKTENALMKITYLQSKYSMSDSIRFDKKGFRFNNIKLTDVKGNPASLSGTVYHHSFKNYSADLTINIPSSGFQVLNTQPKDNQMFYGTAYASGVAKIKSDQNTLSFDVSARSGKGSRLAIPLNKSLSVSEYSYITFKDTASTKKVEAAEKAKVAAAATSHMTMELNMNLEVTPDAEIQIIFDAKVGDVMKGHGSSENLNVNLNKKGEFKIFGDYIIEDGEYTFTLGPIINKPFSVENGGRIMFNGDLDNAEIDLKASYLNMKASLETILENENYKRSVRVEPQLNLSGKLFNPVVGFDIFLPDADEETRTMLKNKISTQEELTRQVSALLLINNFIATGNSQFATTTNATSAMAATSFEMISNQMSNMLSQISKNVDIGLNIRPGYNAITPQEAQLALSTQLLKNKVVINGNFDVRGSGYSSSPLAGTSSTNQLTGDFDAELKLTEKLRLKVFNRFNDTYFTGLSPYTQGVGIFFKQDFNRFSDLFKKKAKSEMKKEEDVKPVSK